VVEILVVALTLITAIIKLITTFLNWKGRIVAKNNTTTKKIKIIIVYIG